MRSFPVLLALTVAICHLSVCRVPLSARAPAASVNAARSQPPTDALRATRLLEVVDCDLRVLEKTQLTGEERKQYDKVKALVRNTRQLLRDAKGEKAAEALSLATWASREAAGLVRRQLKLDELTGGAELYRSGRVATALQTASTSLASDLEAPVRYLEENRDRLGLEGSALAGIDDRTLAALALLQTELAFQGQFDGSARLALARRLLAAADSTRLPGRFAERWYVAVAGHLQGEFQVMDLMLHVEDGVRRFPTDADILVVAGMFYEVVASPSLDLPARAPASRVQSVQMTSGDTSRAPAGGHGAAASPLMATSESSDARYERLVAAKHTGLGRAEEFYRKALAADAGHAEAHLRLGRVLFLTSRSDAALPELQIAAESRSPRIHYLASMFQGGVQEAAARLDAAIPCYEEALRTCPNCFSASLALSHAQRRSGDPDLAVRTLDGATSRDATATFDDYWWDYPLGALRQRDSLMRDLREGLR